jgi:hypothetical protein
VGSIEDGGEETHRRFCFSNRVVKPARFNDQLAWPVPISCPCHRFFGSSKESLRQADKSLPFFSSVSDNRKLNEVY